MHGFSIWSLANPAQTLVFRLISPEQHLAQDRNGFTVISSAASDSCHSKAYTAECLQQSLMQ